MVDAGSWPRPSLFTWLQQQGSVAEEEMHRVFNCGIGMVAVVAAADAKRAAGKLRAMGETVYEIGTVGKAKGEPAVVIS
jgi:phosphoribosylformylglycinamidine cyclo-ligase